MGLNPTQTTYLTQKLGVRTDRFFLDLPGKYTDSRLVEAIDEYTRDEQALLKQLKTLRTIVGSGPIVDDIEREMKDVQKNVKAAQRDGGVDMLKSETAKVKKLQGMAKTGIDNPDFYKALLIAEEGLKAVQEHPQRTHVAGEIGKASPALQQARNAASQGDLGTGQTKLTEGDNAQKDAKRFADQFATVIPVKADAMRILATVKPYYDQNDAQDLLNRIDTAFALAQPGTRNYVQAKSDLKDVVDEVKPKMLTWFGTKAPDKEQEQLKRLRQNQIKLANNFKGPTIVEDDIKEIDRLLQQATNDINAGKYQQAACSYMGETLNLIIAAASISDRRLAYDAQKKKTLEDIKKITDRPQVKQDDFPMLGGDTGAFVSELNGQAFSMLKLVEKADGLATRKTLRIEEGTAQLADISNTATVQGNVLKDARTYTETRLKAEEGLDSLKKTAAARAGMIDDQIAYIEKLMADALQATGAINLKEIPSVGDVDWAKARTTVEQALASIQSTTKMAEGMGPSTEMAGRANNANSADMIEKVAADMRKEGEAIKSKPSGAKAEELVRNLNGTLDEAVRMSKEQARLPAAQELIKQAAGYLLGAQTIQAQYAQFSTDKTAADNRQNKLTGSTEVDPQTLKPKTDESAKLLTQAQDAADTFTWDKANDALRAALAIIAEAEEAEGRRKTFDTALAEVKNDARGLTNPLLGQVNAMITKSEESAKDFDFVHATRFLENAAAQVAGEVVKSKAAAGNLDADFDKAVAKMLKATGGEELLAKSTDNPNGPKAIPGGPELLDKIVAQLSDNVRPEVIIKLAEKRFGVKMNISAFKIEGNALKEFMPTAPYVETTPQLKELGGRTKTAKSMYESMAMTPMNSKNNPSMKTMDRDEAFHSITRDPMNGNITKQTTSGGGFTGATKHVSMQGRPGDVMMQYGQSLVDKGELPPVANDIYKPADEAPLVRFKKSNSHEIGHAIDDRLGFMASREGQANFGNWAVHGGDLNPIARRVAKKFAGDQAGALEQFVLDVMAGGNPDIPGVAPADQIAVNQGCKTIRDWYKKATSGQPWYSQSTSELLAMEDGRVYQEAYARNWVSYPLSERTKGITGYQFRAPGEWFCELFAAYKLGKLKQGHPARQWLSSLEL